MVPGSSSRTGSTGSSSRVELGRFAHAACGQWHNCIQELGQAASKQLGLPGSGHCHSTPSPAACCRAADCWMHPTAEQLQGTKAISRPCTHCNMLREVGSNVTLLGLFLQSCSLAGIVPVPVGERKHAPSMALSHPCPCHTPLGAVPPHNSSISCRASSAIPTSPCWRLARGPHPCCSPPLLAALGSHPTPLIASSSLGNL